jgi:hypothetical protein
MIMQSAYWKLFAETGDPALYLAYRLARAAAAQG